MTICGPEGRRWFRNAVPHAECVEIENICDATAGERRRFSSRAAVSSLWEAAPSLRRLAGELSPELRPLRVVYFDKNAASDWSLPWHQDRVIAVADRQNLLGFSCWSKKDGVWHCEPPIELLVRMIVLRIHLDPQGAEEGAMEIAVGSHKAGRVLAEVAAETAMQYPREVNEAERGDVMAMDALTLHRSGRNHTGAARRTIRIDLSSDELPSPLNWAFC